MAKLSYGRRRAGSSTCMIHICRRDRLCKEAVSCKYVQPAEGGACGPIDRRDNGVGAEKSPDAATRAAARREAAGASASELLEQETAFLVRALEAAQRLHKYPLERAHYLALRVIEHQGPQTVAFRPPSAARQSTVTRQVIEMEQEGLVAKHPNPADRRSALVDITARGLSEAMRMRRQRTEQIDGLVCDWSARQRRDSSSCWHGSTPLWRGARENPPSSGKSARAPHRSDGAAPSWTLATIKADKRLAKMILVVNSRLSVQPVTADEWRVVLALAKG